VTAAAVGRVCATAAAVGAPPQPLCQVCCRRFCCQHPQQRRALTGSPFMAPPNAAYTLCGSWHASCSAAGRVQPPSSNLRPSATLELGLCGSHTQANSQQCRQPQPPTSLGHGWRAVSPRLVGSSLAYRPRTAPRHHWSCCSGAALLGSGRPGLLGQPTGSFGFSGYPATRRDAGFAR
jgi:hypothetical protein